MYSKTITSSIASIALSLIALVFQTAHLRAAWDTNYQIGSLGFSAEPDLVITSVRTPGWAASQGLKAGDQLTHIDNVPVFDQRFESDESRKGQNVIGNAIDRAERNQVPLKLTFLRPSTNETLNLSYQADPAFRGFSSTYPYNCPKSDYLFNLSCDYLRDTGYDSVSAPLFYKNLALLAILSRGNAADMAFLQGKVNEFTVDAHMGIIPADPKDRTSARWSSLGNWGIVSRGLFLAEYRRISGANDSKLDAAIQLTVDHFLAIIRDDNGTLGHHWGGDYSGGGMVIMNCYFNCMCESLKLQNFPGIQNNSLFNQKYNQSRDAVINSMFDQIGTVGYSPSGKGEQASGGRTGASMISMAQGPPANDPGLSKYMSRGVMGYRPEYVFHSHGSTIMAMAFMPSGLHANSPDTYRAYMDQFRWYHTLCYQKFSDAESISINFLANTEGGSGLNSYTRAALTLGLPHSKLYFHQDSYLNTNIPYTLKISPGTNPGVEFLNVNGSRVSGVAFKWTQYGFDGTILAQGNANSSSSLIQLPVQSVRSTIVVKTTGNLDLMRTFPHADPGVGGWQLHNTGSRQVSVDSDGVVQVRGGEGAFQYYRFVEGDFILEYEIPSISASTNWEGGLVAISRGLDPGAPRFELVDYKGRASSNSPGRRPNWMIHRDDMKAGAYNNAWATGENLKVRLQKRGAILYISESSDGVTWIERTPYGCDPSGNYIYFSCTSGAALTAFDITNIRFQEDNGSDPNAGDGPPSPQLTQYQFTVSADAKSGSVFGSVNANGDASYELMDPAGLFNLDYTTGNLSVVAPLAPGTYSFDVYMYNDSLPRQGVKVPVVINVLSSSDVGSDAYVRGGSHSSNNYGSETTLMVKNDPVSSYARESYVRFAYDRAPGELLGAAVLTLTPTSVQGGRTIRVRLVDDSGDGWDEGGITWSNRPQGSGLEMTFSSSEMTANQPYQIDVTDLLNQAQEWNGVATFHIDTTTVSATGVNAFASKEYANTAYRPKLEVASSYGDAYVQGGSYSGNNYGSETTLLVKNDAATTYARESYVRMAFDQTPGEPLGAAVLTLTPTSVQDGRTIRVRLVDDSGDGWDEDGITWDNRPLGSGLEVTFSSSKMTADLPYQIDVTDLLNQAKERNGVATFHIDTITESATGVNAFASREHENTAYHPKLEVAPSYGDAYVRGGSNSGNNYGSETSLMVKNDSVSTYARESYVRMAYNRTIGEPLGAAVLTLTPTSVQGGRTIRVRLVDDANDGWDEDGITWSNRPLGSGLEVTFSSSEMTANQPYQIDVTDLLNQAKEWNGVATFHIDTTTESATGVNTFASREHANASYRPKLEVAPSYGDTYVRGGSFSGYNYGLDTSLLVKNDASSTYARESYVRLAYNRTIGEPLGAAVLTLTPTSVQGGRTIRVRLVDDANDGWDEDGITWSNRPLGSGLEVTFSSSEMTANQPYQIDVTDLLNQAQEWNGVATFHIDTTTVSSIGVNAFASREYWDTDYHPKLEVFPSYGDAYVQGGGNSGSNYGSETSLMVKNDATSTYARESYVRIAYDRNVSEPLGAAFLTLTPTSVQGGRTIRVRLVDDSGDGWDEDGITWSNRPLGSGLEVTFSSSEMTANQPYRINVTALLSQVQEWNGVATFHIDTTTVSSTGVNTFASREHENTVYHPKLEVYADSDNDGLGDSWEIAYLGSISAQNGADDNDGDGLSNLAEFLLGTAVSSGDTDGDGYSDGFEVSQGSDPLDILDSPNTLLVYLWDFNSTNFGGDKTVDAVSGVSGIFVGGAQLSNDGGGFSGVSGDKALQLGSSPAGKYVDVADVVALQMASQNDQLTISFWQKLNQTGLNMSAFWAVSPSSGSGYRGLQAHTPWSNNTIYFDMGNTSSSGRISCPTPSGTTWTGWNHIALVKNGTTAQIYVNGVLAHTETGKASLVTDYTKLVLGANYTGADNVNGSLDDFAIFRTALTGSQISLLASGVDPVSVE